MTNLLVGKSIKGFPIFVLLFFTSLNIQAQRSEIGFGLGGLSYTGDLVRYYRLTDNRPAGVIYYRTNLSRVVSLRYSGTLGMLQGKDDRPFDVLALNRNAEFSIFIVEPAITFEYHFLDYKSKNSAVRFSPYFFGGAGMMVFFGQEESPENYSNFQPVIPFGAGIKYILNPKWSLNLEFGARKTFFDYIDNISEGNIIDKNYQYGNKFDKDAYYYVGISLSYSFYSVFCPFDFY
ncbi:DUF6089 family protein [Fulvivirgaceae bacterium BMA10]|uniref:DUF6089 family protein n=1 Tax=Splendidivirga corallicola TaxID=3051826 RepID=A0ABT8KLG3_9BACT|nr:DUF6089 family protein [Fulvivirgaceae bacterium BMA10]